MRSAPASGIATSAPSTPPTAPPAISPRMISSGGISDWFPTTSGNSRYPSTSWSPT